MSVILRKLLLEGASHLWKLPGSDLNFSASMFGLKFNINFLGVVLRFSWRSDSVFEVSFFYHWLLVYDKIN